MMGRVVLTLALPSLSIDRSLADLARRLRGCCGHAYSAISPVERSTGRASRGGLSPFLRPHPRPVPALDDWLARAGPAA